MQAAWAEVGFQIVSGQIWNIPDWLVTFADQQSGNRTLHERRYVLVLQGDDWDHGQICDSILIAPLSSQIDQRRPWEARIEPGETVGRNGRHAFGRSSLVKLQLIQPIHRQLILDSQGLTGDVDQESFIRIRMHLAQNLSIADI
jgi:hypothetical protein